ncbi:MAG: hypothetical protein QMC67_10425 [Candidatus Wallbacteria bacterium]
MIFFKYWARSSKHRVKTDERMISLWCWGWSSVSLEDARNNAETRVLQAVERLNSRQCAENYPYGANPLKEVLVKSDEKNTQSPRFVITQNSYGCHVLNTGRLMFVDVDIEMPLIGFEGLKKLWASLTFKKYVDPLKRLENEAIDKLNKYAANNSDFGARVYKTKNGFRYIISNREYEPAGADTIAIFNMLGADPMYSRLCKLQNTFRARLTPKSWRIGLDPIRISYPFENKEFEDNYKNWNKKYFETIENFATCRFLFEIGNSHGASNLEDVIVLHDEMTKAYSSLPLA